MSQRPGRRKDCEQDHAHKQHAPPPLIVGQPTHEDPADTDTNHSRGANQTRLTEAQMPFDNDERQRKGQHCEIYCVEGITQESAN